MPAFAGVTHLYNAMSGFVPRAPGVVGAALDRAAIFAGKMRMVAVDDDAG